MNLRILLLWAALIAAIPASQAQKTDDWARHARFEKANGERTEAPRVVFIGNSITELWYLTHPRFFDDRNFVGRGISGQVTAQILARFQADVVALRPEAVVILAGTNDIARNNGKIAIEHIAENIFSMAEIARANRIDPIICSVLPAKAYGWRKEVTDAPQQIEQLNALLRTYAEAHGIPYVDFHGRMADSEGGLPAELAKDGVHPTPAGYDLMEATIGPLLERYCN